MSVESTKPIGMFKTWLLVMGMNPLARRTDVPIVTPPPGDTLVLGGAKPPAPAGPPAPPAPPAKTHR